MLGHGTVTVTAWHGTARHGTSAHSNFFHSHTKSALLYDDCFDDVKNFFLHFTAPGCERAQTV
jgi:hypothetical protein